MFIFTVSMLIIFLVRNLLFKNFKLIKRDNLIVLNDININQFIIVSSTKNHSPTLKQQYRLK